MTTENEKLKNIVFALKNKFNQNMKNKNDEIEEMVKRID
jgi:hypothetical protein